MFICVWVCVLVTVHRVSFDLSFVYFHLAGRLPRNLSLTSPGGERRKPPRQRFNLIKYFFTLIISVWRVWSSCVCGLHAAPPAEVSSPWCLDAHLHGTWLQIRKITMTKNMILTLSYLYYRRLCCLGCWPPTPTLSTMLAIVLLAQTVMMHTWWG